jgi:DUF971 family protein
MSHKPKNITLNKKTHELIVHWQDGHTSTYPLNELREACPCAFCRGGHEFMGREHDPLLIEIKPVKHYEVVKLEPAGKYALQFHWDDGHNSGIYNWEYLRRLDPLTDDEGNLL